MSDTKTRRGALTFPSDPLAAMRELSDLDAPPAAGPPDVDVNVPSPEADVNNLANKLTSNLANKLDSHITSNMTDHITDRPGGQTAGTPRGGGGKARRPQASSTLDPVEQAILTSLALPYPDEKKPERELVATRIRKEVSRRLTDACRLLDRDKQDLVDRAIVLFLQDLVEKGGVADW